EDLLETDRLGAKLEDGPAVPPDHVARGARELGVILAFEHEAARRRLDREYARHGAERGGDLRWRSVHPQDGAPPPMKALAELGGRPFGDETPMGDDDHALAECRDLRDHVAREKHRTRAAESAEPLAHHVVTGDAHLAAGRREDAREDAERRRLPGAVRTEEADDLSGGDTERDAGHRLDATERFPQVSDLERRFRRHAPRHPRRSRS